nr:MAG TPA: hypothetical protein [Caudoviricetes sp.]
MKKKKSHRKDQFPWDEYKNNLQLHNSSKMVTNQ